LATNQSQRILISKSVLPVHHYHKQAMNTTLDTKALQNILSELSQTLQTGDLSKNENARQDALRISRKLTARLQTPSELAFDTCFLPAYSACCRAAIHIGIFEVIAKSAGPITAAEIADQTSAQHLLIGKTFAVWTAKNPTIFLS
jgi:hypothetical protein